MATDPDHVLVVPQHVAIRNVYIPLKLLTNYKVEIMDDHSDLYSLHITLLEPLFHALAALVHAFFLRPIVLTNSLVNVYVAITRPI